MSDERHQLVPIAGGLPAKVGKQLKITEKILARRSDSLAQATVFHVPLDGTIEEAVKRIAPGGTIKIAAGEYELVGPLLIDKPLRMEGAGIGKSKSIIKADFPFTAIHVETAGYFSFSGIKVECYSMIEDRSLGSAILSISCEKADIYKSAFVSIDPRISVSIAQRCWRDCIVVTDSSICTITDCLVNGGRSGIEFKDTSAGRIDHNRCLRNRYGMTFTGTSNVVATKNILWRNYLSGIIAKDNTSSKIIQNICARSECGISLSDASRVTIFGNLCFNNYHGIEVGNKCSVEIISNRCDKNRGDGIALTGSCSSVVSYNICRHNKLDGISVAYKANATLKFNHCEDNDGNGILVFEESTAELIENHCNNNHESGISFRHSAKGIASGNVCSFNKLSLISVQDSATAELTNNMCEETNNVE